VISLILLHMRVLSAPIDVGTVTKFHQNLRSFLKNFLVWSSIFKCTISVKNYTTLS